MSEGHTHGSASADATIRRVGVHSIERASSSDWGAPPSAFLTPWIRRYPQGSRSHEHGRKPRLLIAEGVTVRGARIRVRNGPPSLVGRSKDHNFRPSPGCVPKPVLRGPKAPDVPGRILPAEGTTYRTRRR